MKEGNKERQSILNKFLSVLSGKPEGTSEDRTDAEWIPLESDPVDVHFAKVFCGQGGYFVYAEDSHAETAYLRSIFGEIGQTRAFCPDPGLRAKLTTAGLSLEFVEPDLASVFISGCDFLVAYNGGIMLNSKHTDGRKPADLPSIVLILAHTDHLVLKLNQALTGIRDLYNGAIPSQITTLHAPQFEMETAASAGTGHNRKELFLLLTEAAT